MRYVLCQHALEMAAVKDQYSVQQLAADGADPAFGDRIRPGRSHGCAQNVDGFAGEHGVEHAGELAVAIPDQERELSRAVAEVHHVTVYRWVQRFTLLLIDTARPCRHVPGDRWFVDETYLKVAGRWVYLYRAIDQFGQVIDVLVSPKRDLAATRRFFTRALEHGPSPIEVTTDHAAAYPRVLDELVPAACHVTEQYGNNPIES